jgi:hypothetical protein
MVLPRLLNKLTTFGLFKIEMVLKYSTLKKIDMMAKSEESPWDLIKIIRSSFNSKKKNCNLYLLKRKPFKI